MEKPIRFRLGQACPKCRGQIYKEEEKTGITWVCIQCGYRDYGYAKGYQDGQTEKIKELKAEIGLLRLSAQKEASYS